MPHFLFLRDLLATAPVRDFDPGQRADGVGGVFGVLDEMIGGFVLDVEKTRFTTAMPPKSL